MDDPDKEYRYKPGTIKSLKLVNFMCHESFELALGPRVNFVIGPNGSGKSALLTALVVVLGGRATVTSRAKKASDFVMYGKKYAKISCVVHNYDKVMEKERAFKPDDYGKEIIIEKIIYKDEQAAKLILKNDKDKKVSERKQELDDLIDHFGILINNPICILNQEISKTFLHSKKPEDKFDLFMKATNLEQIEQDYSEAKKIHKDWHTCIDRKAIGFKMLDSEYRSCQEKVGFLMNRAKLQTTHANLTRELLWAITRDSEKRCEEQEKVLVNIDKTIDKCHNEIEQSQGKIKSSEEQIAEIKIELKSHDELCENSKAVVDELRMKETKLKTEKIDIDHKLDSKRRQLDRLQRDKESLEKSIADIKKRFIDENTLAQDNERRKLEIESIEREISSEKARERTIRQHSDQLGQSITETRSEMHKANSHVNELNLELSTKETMLRRLKGGQQNELKKYGDWMEKLCNRIDDAHKQGRFRQKPFGPLGHYIKLKQAEVAKSLELHLGRNAFAFTCDNHADLQVLQGIVKGLRRETNFREPLVLTRKFVKKHDVGRFKVRHDQFQTLLDYIDIDEDPVFNALVDRTGLEQILFVPEFEDAENLMITPSLIPRGVRCAYTKDCHTMYPRTANMGYRCIAPNNPNSLCLFSKGNSAQIKEIEKEIENIKSNLRTAQNQAKTIEVSLKTQRQEFDSNHQVIRSIVDGLRSKEEKLLGLRTTLTTVQPQELSAFESELEACLSKIAQVKMSLEQDSAALAKLSAELQERQETKENAMTKLNLRQTERQRVNDKITSEMSLIRSHQDKIKQNELKLNNLTKDKSEHSQLLNAVKEKLSQNKRNLVELARPSTIRPTEQIKEEQKRVERQLSTEIEENVDPEQLMRSLKKRMNEIENIVDLKDHNQRNFDFTAKTLKDRDEGIRLLRTNTVGSVSSTFSSVTRAMGMNGQLTIHMKDHIVNGEILAKARTLEMHIDTTPSQRPGAMAMSESNLADDISSQQQQRALTRSQPAEASRSASKRTRSNESLNEKENKRMKMTDTRSLSGGERSFSTVAFVLALWHHCSSPFKLMDEIDVFMDMVTRRLSYNSLIQFAQVTDNPGQFVFFSPLELPKIDDPGKLVRVFEMPRIIRKGNPSSSSSTQADGGDQLAASQAS